jgi:hypothetical protein
MKGLYINTTSKKFYPPTNHFTTDIKDIPLKLTDFNTSFGTRVIIPKHAVLKVSSKLER